jgi:hypothetical protein
LTSNTRKLSSHTLLACATKCIEALAYREVAQTDSAQNIDEFSRESAGNSPTPEIDIQAVDSRKGAALPKRNFRFSVADGRLAPFVPLNH